MTEARDSIESLENRDPTVFEIRKADHKKKFTTGIPERTQITMFDLVRISHRSAQWNRGVVVPNGPQGNLSTFVYNNPINIRIRAL